MVGECRTNQDFDRLVASSHTRPVFLFKHSTRCPISGSRWRAYESFAGMRKDADFARVLVVENRSVSAYVAGQTDVTHQSPQAILLFQGEPVWHVSHWSITEEAMTAALEGTSAS